VKEMSRSNGLVENIKGTCQNQSRTFRQYLVAEQSTLLQGRTVLLSVSAMYRSCNLIITHKDRERHDPGDMACTIIDAPRREDAILKTSVAIDPLLMHRFPPLPDSFPQLVKQWESLFERDTCVGDGHAILQSGWTFWRYRLFAFVDIGFNHNA